MSDERPLSPDAERAIAKVRRLMLIASVTTFLALAVVLGVIGYRVFHLGGSAPEPVSFADATAALPAGAKVLSTAIGADHIMVTIDVGGTVQILTFDPDTLKPLGRLQLKAP
jgi:Na+/proline symporter